MAFYWGSAILDRGVREGLSLQKRTLEQRSEGTKELCETVVFILYCASTLLGGLVKIQIDAPFPPGFLIQHVWLLEMFAFLINSMVMLLLLTQGPHLENH